ncbi:3-oxoacyl-[acyl-carrier-protein] reductase [Clostridium sediminicola]|uniref:3-oxoacyl-[acyl-carrier-protein] reductase n=1 Tax=Clostridium sediminicola TaxID=3114879 RepID=UPI0031F23162
MLNGKTAIVTGASRGIGKAVALKLAEHGANIVINYRNSKEAALAVVSEIEQKGVKALAIQADVSKFDEAKDLILKAKEELGSVDILINNAGVTKDGVLLRMKEEDFDSVIDINLKGVFNCIRHVVPIMMKQRSGKIISMTSVVGILGNAGQANYSASKAGIIGLTKSTAKEIGGRGITVNAIAPGFIETEMTGAMADKYKEAIIGSTALRKLGKPENVADAVYFLASSMGDYITGQVLSVDGGMAF